MLVGVQVRSPSGERESTHMCLCMYWKGYVINVRSWENVVPILDL